MAIGSDYTKIFADRLQDLIELKKSEGKTFKEIALESGVPTGSLSKYQNDAAEAGVNSLVKLAKYFDVSTDYMLGISDVPNGNADDMAIEKRLGIKGGVIEELTWFRNRDGCKFFNMLFEDGYCWYLQQYYDLYYDYMEAALSESDYSSDYPEYLEYERPVRPTESDIGDLLPGRSDDSPGFYLYLSAGEYADLRLRQINDSFSDFMKRLLEEALKIEASESWTVVKKGKKQSKKGG